MGQTEEWQLGKPRSPRWWGQPRARQTWEKWAGSGLRGDRIQSMGPDRKEENKGCVSSLHHCSLSLPRLVSSVQAVMASTAGYIVSTSCKHIIDDQ